jgi:hypothetical protein
VKVGRGATRLGRLGGEGAGYLVNEEVRRLSGPSGVARASHLEYASCEMTSEASTSIFTVWVHVRCRGRQNTSDYYHDITS